MDKVIKEFKNEGLTYKLGYDLENDKVHPYIEIFKGRILLSGGIWSIGNINESFYFCVNISPNVFGGYINTIKELFIKLKKYNNIPEEVETEFEKIFLTYKLNGFRED